MKPINLTELVEAMEMVDWDSRIYINRNSREIQLFNESYGFDEDVFFEDTDWLIGPTQEDIHEYGIMEIFAHNQASQAQHDALYNALQGKGAFRRFKDQLRRLGLSDEWLHFKEQAFLNIARQWCIEHDIDYDEPETETIDQTRSYRIRVFQPEMMGQVAHILVETFHESYQSVGEDLRRMSQPPHNLLVALVGKEVVGLIGAIPQYGRTGWELHPLAVKSDYRSMGIGTALVAALEEKIRHKGGIVIYLGSDDETGSTSLSQADLWSDPLTAIKNIENYSNHPYSFYQKLGYQIVGVIPDANGFGKPDIWLAKSISTKPIELSW